VESTVASRSPTSMLMRVPLCSNETDMA
jgi:hypothetical protein